MWRILLVMLMLALSGGWLLADEVDTTQIKLLESRQKEAWKALKLKQKYAREAWRNGRWPQALRRQFEHQLKSEERRLRAQQQDERQQIKDQQRLMHQGWR